MPASSLLPYSQNMRFTPRDDIGDVPLGYDGAKSTTLVWEVNGAKSLELQITTAAGSGHLRELRRRGSIQRVAQRRRGQAHSALGAEWQLTRSASPGKGYYIATIYVVKADGSTTYIPRNIIVDCYKKQ